MGAIFAADVEKKKRLHVGSGTIYLIDYMNVELPSPVSGAALATDNPAGVRKWATEESDYYGKLNDVSLGKFVSGYPLDHRDIVCDAYGSFDNLPCDDTSIEEILSRQVFEHMSVAECEAALMECRRVLVDGGIVRLDVPDHEESLRLYAESDERQAFFKRHIFGSRKNAAAYHIMGWTRKSLAALLDDHGFDFVEEEPNIHLYPAFCLRFRKRADEALDGPRATERPWFAAWEYCGEKPGIRLTVPDDWNVLELGCGTRPWPRADHYFDIDDSVRESLPFEKQDCFTHGDVHCLKKDWTNKFDYVFAAHILEHCEDPHLVSDEINRVTRAGCVVCPSSMKDALFGFHESDHKWMAMPSSKTGTILLMKVDPVWRDAIYDEDMSKAMHQMLRLERRRFGAEGRKLREWFVKAEPLLDVVVKWQGRLNVEIVG